MFQPPQATYDHNLTGLQFVEYQSGSVTQRIPLAIIPRNSKTTIIYSHGNACDLGHVYDHMQRLSRVLEVNVWLYDYPGYGLAEGHSPTEANVCEAIERVYEHYDAQAKPGDKLLIMGTSIGSGPSCYLASKLKRSQYAGLLLECPLASAFGAVSECSAETSSAFDAFKNYVWATKVNRPVMIIHGTADEVIAHSQAEKLAASFAENLYAFWSVQDAGHNDLIVCAGLAEYYERLAQFFRYTILVE